MSPKDSNALNREKLLLKRIADGDQAAFSVVYHQYRKKIYTYALKITKSSELAEDVLHEVFLKIWQHGHQEEIEHLEGYLRVITRNYTLNLLRRLQLEAKTKKEMLNDWTELRRDTEEIILLNDTRKLLQEAITHLPPQQKLAYQLCREEGLKYQEAAERMDILRLTVKTHMQHALRFLRAYLSTHTL